MKQMLKSSLGREISTWLISDDIKKYIEEVFLILIVLRLWLSQSLKRLLQELLYMTINITLRLVSFLKKNECVAHGLQHNCNSDLSLRMSYLYLKKTDERGLLVEIICFLSYLFSFLFSLDFFSLMVILFSYLVYENKY